MSLSTKNQSILSALDSHLHSNHGFAQEPDWVMQIAIGAGKTAPLAGLSDNQGTFKVGSETVKLADCATVYDYQFGLTRAFARESMTMDLVPAGLCAHELKIVAPFSSIPVQVHQAFADNTAIGCLWLIRLTTVSAAAGATEAPMEGASQYLFDNLFITGIVSKYDLICLSFRYTSIQYNKNSINPLTAKAAGKTAAAYHNLANAKGKATKNA